jgi:hypothetical protein
MDPATASELQENNPSQLYFIIARQARAMIY